MRHSPILLLHTCARTLGMLSGFVAIFLRKGSGRHIRRSRLHTSGAEQLFPVLLRRTGVLLFLSILPLLLMIFWLIRVFSTAHATGVQVPRWQARAGFRIGTSA